MLLYHTTPDVNFDGIRCRGLLLSQARSTRPLIWLHTWSRLGWARIHVAKRHHVTIEQTGTFGIDVPRHWLRRVKMGLYCCDSNVPREHLSGYIPHPAHN